MAAEWFFQSEGQQLGPAELRRLADSRLATPNTLGNVACAAGFLTHTDPGVSSCLA